MLGFEDFKNWGGVGFGFRGVPMAIIKLKEAIDVDDLLCVQYFEFDRVSTRGGKTHTDTFACKIRGLGQKQTTQSHFPDLEHLTALKNGDADGNSRL